jgi:ribosomal protein S18 acetylase RimI-like enzyme
LQRTVTRRRDDGTVFHHALVPRGTRQRAAAGRHNLAYQQMEAPAKIERAAMQDVLSIKELLRETWHDTYASLLPQTAIEHITSEWHSPALLAEQIRSPDTYFAVARDGGVVAGVITARQQDDAIVVARLYVRPQHQRRGIGRKLLESSYRAFSDAQRVRLTVEADNRKGVVFYTKQGFREVARSCEEIAGARLENVIMERAL